MAEEMNNIYNTDAAANKVKALITEGKHRT